MSSPIRSHFLVPTTSFAHHDHHTPSTFYSTPTTQSDSQSSSSHHPFDHTAYAQTLAYLQQSSLYDASSGPCASNASTQTTQPERNNTIPHLSPSPWADVPEPASFADPTFAPQQLSQSMYNQGPFRNSLGPSDNPTQQYQQSLKRARTHARTPSASTVASTGPASPFSYNTSFPHIAQPEYTPHSPASNIWDFSGPQADQASFAFSKSPLNSTDSFFLNVPGYAPSQTAHTPAAHLAMKGFAIDHHNLEDMPSEFPHSSRQSMSSVGQDSPATPRSTVEDGENKQPKQNNNGENAMNAADAWGDYLLFVNPDYRTPNPNVQLHRTESAAYQDELYNPANFSGTPPSAARANNNTGNNLLTPHRNLINERLQTANIARSVSPTSASRERSPFRHGSPLAPATDAWNSSRPAVGTQAGMRQQQKEETAQAEIAQHRPTLHREPTKTISPKDALLDYNDADQTPLFQDTIPTGYKQHFGGTEQFPSNFFNQGNAAFSVSQPTSQPNMTSFRATNSADGFSGGNFPVQAPFQTGNYQQANNMNNYNTGALTEPTPDFPAHLTSMESSMSEGNAMPSSQEGTSLPVQRPADTRAGTGTYTCTYHGCTQRFESQPALQRHKRDYHRSQAHANRDSGAESGTASVSPSSPGTRLSESQSPGPSDEDESGMTSAALLARNSQAGPHKCTRVNPSTGKPCNTVFSRPYDLTRHEDTIHNNRKIKVKCPYCKEEKLFSRNDALTRHCRVVHPEYQGGKRGRD
ncbi:hypothetical protein Q7P37_005590 [Cladosporium fusiforme]